jgi:hypothetical protein
MRGVRLVGIWPLRGCTMHDMLAGAIDGAHALVQRVAHAAAQAVAGQRAAGLNTGRLGQRGGRSGCYAICQGLGVLVGRGAAAAAAAALLGTKMRAQARKEAGGAVPLARAERGVEGDGRRPGLIGFLFFV